MKIQNQKVNILRLTLIVLSGGFVCGLFGSFTYIVYPDVWDYVLLRRPEYMFRILIADPIPEGISDIQVIDLSSILETVYVGAFHTTPDATAEIINHYELHLDDFFVDPPYEYFPNIEWNKDWTHYEGDIDYRISLNLWVSPNEDQVIFRYVND